MRTPWRTGAAMGGGTEMRGGCPAGVCNDCPGDGPGGTGQDSAGGRKRAAEGGCGGGGVDARGGGRTTRLPCAAATAAPAANAAARAASSAAAAAASSSRAVTSASTHFPRSTTLYSCKWASLRLRPTVIFEICSYDRRARYTRTQTNSSEKGRSHHFARDKTCGILSSGHQDVKNRSLSWGHAGTNCF